MTSPSFRDIEMLTAYLDGQLETAAGRRLESRLETEPALRSTLEAMRESRTILRRVPQRRAPRNFTLKPGTAGVRAPLPRTYPLLRFASAFAAILFFLSLATNYAVPLAASRQPLAAAPVGMGGGGGAPQDNGGSGGGCDGPDCGPPTLQAPAGTAEAPAALAPAAQMAGPAPTETPALETFAAEAATAELAPSTKLAPAPQEPLREAQGPSPLIPAFWEYSLLALTIVFGGGALAVRWQTDRRFTGRGKK